MKFYQLRKQDPDLGVVVSWYSTKKEATKTGKAWQKETGATRGEWDVWTYVLDPCAEGIVHWLNVHFKTDNG